LIKNNNIITALFISFFLITQICSAQSNKSLEDGINYLSLLIANNQIKSNSSDDLKIVDSLYLKAVQFYDGDISESLLALTFATLPFNKMPVSIPFIDYKIDLKLPSVKHSLFEMKKKNLPGIVYFDSRFKGGQDKDKVAHFFGNAFLAYNFSYFNLSKFMGIFVEMFEATFKVSGGIDSRDLQTNYLGEFFGYSLTKNPKLLPSQFFDVYSLFYFSYN
jgi:hypothetical protein